MWGFAIVGLFDVAISRARVEKVLEDFERNAPTGKREFTRANCCPPLTHRQWRVAVGPSNARAPDFLTMHLRLAFFTRVEVHLNV